MIPVEMLVRYFKSDSGLGSLVVMSYSQIIKWRLD